MANETSLATTATRDSATQLAATSAGGIGAHVGGDWWQHNQVNATTAYPWQIAAAESPSDAAHSDHIIESSGHLRLVVSLNGTDAAIVIPFIDGGVFSGSGTWSGSPGAVAPTFSVQPEDTTVAIGDTLTLTCSVDGTPPILMRWTKDGEPIGSNSTSPTLTIASFQEEDSGQYICIATNATGQTLSNAATVAVETTTGESVPTRIV